VFFKLDGVGTVFWLAFQRTESTGFWFMAGANKPSSDQLQFK